MADKKYWNARYAENRRNKRKENKLQAIDAHGGKCTRCGFRGHPEVFDFHHMDPSTKDPKIKTGFAAAYTSSDSMQSELSKCVLLCANCHREIHARLRELQVQPT